MKIETGVMVMKRGKAWGVIYSDGHSTLYGWIKPDDAEIHNPKHCNKPTDLTFKGSIYEKELLTAEIVNVERRTELVILGNNIAI